MIFGQLIEYKMKNIFIKKSYTKCGGETSPRLFHKKIEIEHISGSTVWNAIRFVFIVCTGQGLPKYIKRSADHTKLFKKTNRS